jgi:hypothetical protein
LWAVVAGFVLCHVAGCRRWWDKLSLRLPPPVLAGAYVLTLTLGTVLAPLHMMRFIYFQF